MKKTTNFITTKDEKIANKLISEGFKLVVQRNGTYTFMNKPIEHLNFTNSDMSKLVYTNILSL